MCTLLFSPPLLLAVPAHRAALAIGLFPSWFADCPDWPSQLKLTDFPLFDLVSPRRRGSPTMVTSGRGWMTDAALASDRVKGILHGRPGRGSQAAP